MASKTAVLVLAVAVLILSVNTLAPAVVLAQEHSVQLVVAGLPAGVKTRYYVDGVLNGTIQTGETKVLSFAPGSAHTLSVDLNVNFSNETRYQCKENLRSFSEAGLHTFTYKPQHRLEVLSAYVSATGADWYDEGTTAYARVPTNVTAGPEGVRYVFVRWEGDASGREITSNAIVMDQAKKAVAVWKTQYSLKMSSDPAGILSSSTLWFDAGSSPNFSAPDATAGADTRYVFAQWLGDYVGTDVKGSLQMDGPKYLIAKYKAQYLLSVVFTPPSLVQVLKIPNSTWYDAGQTVRLGPVPQLINTTSVERLSLTSWNVDGMTQQGTSIDVPMDRAHHVEVIYQTQYFLKVTSSIGETKGSGWYFSGERARFGVTYSGSDFPVKYTLAKWQPNPPSAVSRISENEAEIVMDRPYAVEAVWNADYTAAWIFVFVIASVAIAIMAFTIIAVRKPGSLRRLAMSLRSGLKGLKAKAPSTALPSAKPSMPCQKCGAKISSSAEYCQKCGAAQTPRRIAPTIDVEALDKRVFDYIVERDGEISLTQASKKLGVSVDEIRRSTERLKKKGLLA